MSIKSPKKLIEVALPLDDINAAAAREKSIRHGHPSTLHLGWARRPLAPARAVIFSQMVADPATYLDVVRADPVLNRKAEVDLKTRLQLHEEARALAAAHGAADLRLIEGAGHHLRHDPRAIAVLLGWLDRQRRLAG